ncbi:M23 family metallopeptidase [Paracoccus sp. (in: a-proteobacteria)]|uniref:M23 family metallopeptidase n=1 Tax=Paracoccus sp. TaxID=267 RepID=UPI0026E0CAD4|nr:M23 family metallopeptidase [Paracoccus sp. (in: a-proteobacteria)]MDO5370889.1 M23 family metallopeptidase [Paracoccus sp. (in: a-proteobacteria)]
MTISVAARAQDRAGFGLGAGRAGICALALALAGCTQPPGAVPGAFPAPSAAGAGPSMTVAGLGRLQMPQIQWPRGAAAAGTTAAAGGGTAQVSDPFAGQGVRQPAVPGAGAPRGSASAAPSGGGAAASARSHTVAAGETAWSIARRYGVPVQDLARANGLPETMSLRLGQRLVIPASGTAATASVVAAPGVGSATPRPPSSAQPLPGEETRPASAPPPRAPAPDLGSTRTAASGSGKFAMPASGSIARAYRKGTNEGIDIAAAPGSPIKAAGSGTVAAVTRDTDGVPIVVVRHDDGLMTVYAGVDKLSVNKGDSVSRGQAIGAARSSGLLHFEVRNGFDSVDPEDYL